jgi:hypothetical protein
LRELHIDVALACMNIPDDTLKTTPQDTYFQYQIRTNHGSMRTTAHEHGDYIFILEGEGRFDDIPVKAGCFLMASALASYVIEGDLTYQITTF